MWSIWLPLAKEYPRHKCSCLWHTICCADDAGLAPGTDAARGAPRANCPREPLVTQSRLVLLGHAPDRTRWLGPGNRWLWPDWPGCWSAGTRTGHGCAGVLAK